MLTSPCVIIMNHRTRFDWLFLWCFLMRRGSLRYEKIILKEGIKRVPLYGNHPLIVVHLQHGHSVSAGFVNVPVLCTVLCTVWCTVFSVKHCNMRTCHLLSE